MSRRAAELVPVDRNHRRPLWRRDSVELLGVNVRPTDHFTRLWPTGNENSGETAPLFRLAMVPARLVALVLLWATSSPARLLLVAALIAAAVLVP